jgi:hypothetical protein
MTKSTWIILGLVVALGSIYFFTREDKVSVGIKRLKLPTFLVDKIDRIEIGSKDKVELVKLNNDSWELDIKDKDGKPHLVKADKANVAGMLDAALSLGHSHYVTNLKEKLPELGLEGDEAVEIKIYSDNSLIWDLILGKNATGSGRYAKLPDSNEVYVVRGSFWQLTRSGIADWRDREIMPVKEGEFTSFKIEKAGVPFISLTKEKGGEEWNIDQSQKVLPKGFRVDKQALSNLVRAAANLRASGFVDEDKELKNPLMSIHVATNDAKYTFEFFTGSNDNYLVKRIGENQIYEISKFNFERVSKSLDDLRDLSLLNFDKPTVVKLSLLHGKSRIVVSKKDNEWRVEEPSKLPDSFQFDPASVDDMITMLVGLTAQRIAHASKDVAQDPKWQHAWCVELVTQKGDKIHLFLGKSKANKDEYLAKGNIDQEIYVVKSGRLTSLNAGLNAFKKEEFELPPIDEHTKGFESLPVDVQRKLLNATKNKK